MMHLVFIPNVVGAHMGGWRHPDAYTGTVMNMEPLIEMAQLAERGKFDAIFLADGNGVRDMDKPELFAANFPSARPFGFEPTTLFSALSMVTQRIGMVATATATYDAPWMVARRFASFDHISKGRAGWNLVTASNDKDALNFGYEEHVSRPERYAKAQEFYEVVAKLWDSWGPDAFPQDRETGRFLDPSRVRPIDHEGAFFTVKGPLSIPPTPQGRPVVFMAGQSEPGRELAARYADALFGAGSTKQDCQEVYADIKGRMARYGRERSSLCILPAFTAFVGRTGAEAEQLYAELQALISPSLGVHYLSKMLVHDLSGLRLDGPLPLERLAGETLGGSSLRAYIIDKARRDSLTIRQTYEWILPAIGGPVFKGTASQIADEMQDWVEGGACDGFVLMSPVNPRGLRDFVELVIPELQRRGLFRTEYEGTTLRSHLGLPPAPSQWDAAARQAAAE